MRFKELRQYLKKDKLVKYLTLNLRIDTPHFTDIVYNKDTDCLAFIIRDGYKSLSTSMIRDYADNHDEISDNTLITIDVPYLKNNNDNIVRWISENDTTIAINEKSSEDIVEELSARYNHHLTVNDSDSDFVQSCFDAGFTLEDFKQVGDDVYSFVKRTKEEFGLSEIHG